MLRLRSIILLFLIAANVFAATNPKNTYVGPTLRLNLGGWASDDTAYSLLGEVGGENYRINATGGYKFSDSQRIKLSAEYLWQDINYKYFTGDTQQWVKQGAIGADYQIDFGYFWDFTFNLNAYLSHAPSKDLDPIAVSVFDVDIPIPFTNFRRIAGSNAGGMAPGLYFGLWEGSQFGLDLNYDKVHYDKKYLPNQNAIGFGGTAHVSQQIGDYVLLAFSAGIRQPFNVYQGSINLNNYYYYGRWGAGIFGNYVDGKADLPNTYNIGVNLNYYFDRNMCVSAPPGNPGEVNPVVASPIDQGFLNWVNDPAVYMPQVLAIADEQVITPEAAVIGCILPTLVTPFPNYNVGEVFIITTAQRFSGPNLSFSITVSPSPQFGDNIVIDPRSGVLTIDRGQPGPLPRTYTLVETATNRCGSVSSNAFTVTYVPV